MGLNPHACKKQSPAFAGADVNQSRISAPPIHCARQRSKRRCTFRAWGFSPVSIIILWQVQN